MTVRPTYEPYPAAWQSRLRFLLHLFGHRNWIVVADSAYPAHSSPGIQTIVCRSGHTEVLRFLIDSLSREPHVEPIVQVDSELGLLQERDAPGVFRLRTELRQLIGEAYREEPHEEILLKLEHASRMFRVLVLKTAGSIPYTSVFFELQCRYWNDEAERRLQLARRLLCEKSVRVG